ncbi:MAG: gamma-glutamylcyclotransferase [Acidobacteriota bacterium]|nr:gamma-glutamylcyclotransferase [Acidobacteriota bacterium]
MKDRTCGAKGHPLLFVYGTLMRSLREKVGAEMVGPGTIRARLYDLGDYPGATLAESGSEDFVKGELYELDDPDRAIKILDKYEEYFPSEPRRSLFTRELVTVTLEGGKKQKAWTYLYNRPVSKAQLIPSENYREGVVTRQWS